MKNSTLKKGLQGVFQKVKLIQHRKKEGLDFKIMFASLNVFPCG